MKKIDGHKILLASGNYFDLSDPENGVFLIEDIAHALSNLCRYTGHCNSFYSVAQHSVAVSYLVPPEHALAGLLHDAAEAYIGDVASPLKSLLPDYKRLEQRVEAALFKNFGLDPVLPQCVKDADLVMLRTEQRDLMGADSHPWAVTEGIEPLCKAIYPMYQKQAQFQFLCRYYDLLRLRKYGSVTG